MKNQKAVVIATSTEGLVVRHCNSCGDTYIGAQADTYCPHCFSDSDFTDEELTAKLRVSVAASTDLQQDVKTLVCSSCNREVIIAGDKRSADDLSALLYCPNCGCGDFVSADATPTDADAAGKKDEIPPLDDSDDEKTEEPRKSDEDDSAGGDEDGSSSDVEDDVKESLSEEALASSMLDELQFAALSAASNGSSDDVLLACNGKAEPVFTLRKSKMTAQAQTIFGQPAFLKAFADRAREVGLLAAVQEFNGDLIKPQAIATAADVERLGLVSTKKIREEFTPRFLEALATAIEGTSKGLYPEITNEFKGNLYDEIVARIGGNEDNVVQGIEAGFANSSRGFSALVAKAIELMEKPATAYEEVKAMVKSAPAVLTANSFGRSSEEEQVRASLQASTSRLQFGTESISQAASMRSMKDASIESLRQQLGFTR